MHKSSGNRWAEYMPETECPSPGILFMGNSKRNTIQMWYETRRQPNLYNWYRGKCLFRSTRKSFIELSKYAPQIIGTEREKAWKFQEGLTYYIKSRITPLMITDYADTLERALVIEDTSDRFAAERQKMQQQKRKPSGRGVNAPNTSSGPQQ